jgi:hypothetical protein
VSGDHVVRAFRVDEFGKFAMNQQAELVSSEVLLAVGAPFAASGHLARGICSRQPSSRSQCSCNWS